MVKYPTVKQLRYFVALAELRHFGRAAKSCFVSQSAFSTAIQELEQLLGTQLVDRTNRQVTITSVGQEVAVQARLCIRDIDSLVEIAGEQQQPLTGELRLGVIPTIAPFLLPKLLPRLRKAYPQLTLFLHEGQTQEIHEKLLAGDLDALLLALPYDLRSVETLPLFQDRFYLAYREGTDRVDPDNFRISRLNADSVLLLGDGHCLRDHALSACKIKNTEKIRSFAASSLLTLVEMVDADLGITFLPELALGSSLLRDTKVRMRHVERNSHRTIGLAWRRGTGRVDEFRLLGEFIRQMNVLRGQSVTSDTVKNKR